MAERNPYLDLMDDEPVRKPKAAAQPTPMVVDTSAPRIAPDWATTKDGIPVKDEEETPVIKSPDSDNPYLALMDDRDEVGEAKGYQPGNLLGVAGSGLSANAERIAEQMAKATPGSVAEMRALMNPAKVAMTPQMAAQLAAEARIPGIAPLAPLPVEKAPPQTGGQKWLENYANLDRPDFAGGVPEAAQTYQRSKPQGKVSSQLYKKFGNKPLNIAGQAAQTAMTEDEALMRVRQALYENEMRKALAAKVQQETSARAAQVEREAQAAAGASRGSKLLSGLGKASAGAGVGLGAYDAYRRQKEGDIYGSIVGGLGTAASVAPMFMGSAGVLPALGAAAPLYLMAHDRIEHLKKHPEDVQLQEDRFDPLGMPIR